MQPGRAPWRMHSRDGKDMSMTTNLPMPLRLYLIRHGETAWSLTGQHTGRTDIPLTEQGEQDARELTERLQAVRFSRVPNFEQTA